MGGVVVVELVGCRVVMGCRVVTVLPVLMTVVNGDVVLPPVVVVSAVLPVTVTSKRM